MEKGRYKYYPVVQHPELPRFSRAFVYLNVREWTDPNGIFRKAACKSIGPNLNGMYVIDTQAEHAKEKIAILNRVVGDGVHPVLGPFDNVEDAVIAERKVRPKTEKERLVFAEAELEILRREKEERKGSKSKE